MERKTHYGLNSEIVHYPIANREMLVDSSLMLSIFFKRNCELYKAIGLTGKQWRAELLAIYGIKVSNTLIREMKVGKRFRCGLLLLTTIKHYWKNKGYLIRIDE